MKHINSGYIIGGATLIGMGLGHLFGNMKAFLFIGIGAGLLGAAFLPSLIKKEKDES